MQFVFVPPADTGKIGLLYYIKLKVRIISLANYFEKGRHEPKEKQIGRLLAADAQDHLRAAECLRYSKGVMSTSHHVRATARSGHRLPPSSGRVDAEGHHA
jgi:hypothetical protein